MSVYPALLGEPAQAWAVKEAIEMIRAQRRAGVSDQLIMQRALAREQGYRGSFPFTKEELNAAFDRLAGEAPAGIPTPVLLAAGGGLGLILLGVLLWRRRA